MPHVVEGGQEERAAQRRQEMDTIVTWTLDRASVSVV